MHTLLHTYKFLVRGLRACIVCNPFLQIAVVSLQNIIGPEVATAHRKLRFAYCVNPIRCKKRRHIIVNKVLHNTYIQQHYNLHLEHEV